MSREVLEPMDLADASNLIAPLMDERKASVMFVAADLGVYNNSSIASTMRAIQPPDSVWPLGRRQPFLYSPTFEAAGFVEEATEEGHPKTYEATDLGRTLGRSIAGHLLGYSRDNWPSLQALGGTFNTASDSGVRPIAKRIEIFKVIQGRSNQKTRIAELAGDIGLEINATHAILKALESANLVTRGTPEVRRSIESFTATPKLQVFEPMRATSGQLHLDIVDLAKKHFADFPDIPVNNDSIIQMLIDTGRIETGSEEIYKEVSLVTYKLAHRRGVLEAHRVIGDEGLASLVWANEDQQHVLKRFTRVVDAVMSPTVEFIEDGTVTGTQILNNQAILEQLFTKAKQNSPGYKRSQKEQARLIPLIESAAKSTGSPKTANQIREILLVGGDRVSYRMIVEHMKKFVEDGKVIADETARSIEYTWLEEEDQLAA